MFYFSTPPPTPSHTHLSLSTHTNTPPISSRRRSWACQQIKSHAVWRVVLSSLRSTSQSITFSHSQPHYDLQCSPPAAHPLWFSPRLQPPRLCTFIVLYPYTMQPPLTWLDVFSHESVVATFFFNPPPPPAPCVNISIPKLPFSSSSFFFQKQWLFVCVCPPGWSTCCFFNQLAARDCALLLINIYIYMVFIWRIPPAIMALLSPPFSRPLLCGKQATQSGETWVTSVRGGREGKGGEGDGQHQQPSSSRFWNGPRFCFFFLPLPPSTPPPLPRDDPPGVVHGGSESGSRQCAWISCCCITALFTVSHVIVIFFFPTPLLPSSGLSWIGICSRHAWNLVSLNVSFFFSSAPFN